MKSTTLKWGRYRLTLGRRTNIMGILNVTPDSFSDGGRYLDPEAALRQGEALVQAGADILDVGGESTRPFAQEVPAAEEIRRVVPVIEALADRVPVPLSIDTTKAEVARRCLEAGAAIINDISALQADPQMGAVAADHGVPVILMHMRGSPRTMQIDPVYQDLIGEIRGFLEDAVVRAESAGIPRERIIVDPGVGFGKTVDHNLELISRLAEFAVLDVPLLVGPSRKAFIRKVLGDRSGEALPPDHPAVESGTQTVVAACALQGAHILRVHDVGSTRLTLKMADALRGVAGRR
jgi:dihydropteroate synthase